MAKQITNTIVMVRPIGFCFNTQTAANDFFQNDLGEKHDIVEAKALIEFDGFADKLRGKGITVHVIQDDDPVFATPDSIFPNNWFVSLEDGKLVLCPSGRHDHVRAGRQVYGNKRGHGHRSGYRSHEDYRGTAGRTAQAARPRWRPGAPESGRPVAARRTRCW